MGKIIKEEDLYKITDDYFFNLDSENFILIQKIVVQRGKTKGTAKYPRIAFFPPTHFGLSLLYEKFMTVSMCNNETLDLRVLKEELDSYYSQFINFLLRIQETPLIKDLKGREIPQEDIEKMTGVLPENIWNFTCPKCGKSRIITEDPNTLDHIICDHCEIKTGEDHESK